MKTFLKKAMTIVITLAMISALPIPAFADQANADTYSYSGVPGTHPYRYTTNQTTTASQQIVLNAYCSSAPVNNTPVTTWPYTGSDTQEWSGGGDVTVYACDGTRTYSGEVISSSANPDVALNINRSYSTPEVNTYSIISNKFADVVIHRSGTSYYVDPRGGVGTRYLQYTSLIPDSGGGRYMRWGTSPSAFYCFC